MTALSSEHGRRGVQQLDELKARARINGVIFLGDDDRGSRLDSRCGALQHSSKPVCGYLMPNDRLKLKEPVML